MSIIDTLLATVGPHNTVLHAHSLKEPRFIQKALHDPNEDACKIKSKRVDHTFKMVNNKPRHNRVYRTVRKPTETTNFSDKQTSIRPRMFIGYTDADKYKWTLMATEQQLTEVPPEQYFGYRFTPTHIAREDHIGFIFSFDENLIYSANYIDKFGNYYVSTSIHPIKFGSEEYKTVFGELSKRDIFVNKSKYKPVQKDKIIPTNETGKRLREVERENMITQFIHYIKSYNHPPTTADNPEQDLLPLGENSLGDNTITPEDIVRLHRKDLWDKPGDTYNEPNYDQNPNAMEEEYPPEKTEDTNKTLIEDKPSVQQIRDITGMENVDNRKFVKFTKAQLNMNGMRNFGDSDKRYESFEASVVDKKTFNQMSKEKQKELVDNYTMIPWRYINNVFYQYMEGSKGTLQNYNIRYKEIANDFIEAQQFYPFSIDETVKQNNGVIFFSEDNNLFKDIFYNCFGEFIKTIGEHSVFARGGDSVKEYIEGHINKYFSKIIPFLNIIYSKDFWN